MYKYSGIQRGANDNPLAPVDNLKFNGVYLDQAIDGYRQLNVEGRHLVSRRVDMTEVPMRRGEWFDGVSDEAREITVQYRLEADTSESMRDKLWELNKLLRSDAPVPFTFDDEPEYEYFGVYAQAPTMAESALVVLSEFTIICPDPWKFKKAQTSSGAITLTDADQVLPERITVTPSGSVGRIEITNGRDVLALAGSYSSGSAITIDYLDDSIEIQYAGRSILYDLQQYSPLETFYLRNGDTVRATGASVTEVRWRDERL